MSERPAYGPNASALERQSRLRDLFMEIADGCRHPVSIARWEALALDRDEFVGAIERDIARVAL